MVSGERAIQMQAEAHHPAQRIKRAEALAKDASAATRQPAIDNGGHATGMGLHITIGISRMR